MKVQTAEWNKIVRDNIPDIIKDSGGTVEISVVEDNNEFDLLMRQKLAEEVVEIQQSETDHLLEEIGDLETVVDALLELHGFTRDELKKQQDEKDIKRGKFAKRIFLIRTKEDE